MNYTAIYTIAVDVIYAILPRMQYRKPYTPVMTTILHTCCCLAFGMVLFGGMPISDAVAAARPKQPLSVKPVDSYTITQRGDSYRVNISYPNLGIPVADAELAIWAREQAAAFTDSVKMISAPIPYGLTITYETQTASSRVVSVVFFISTSTGGAHPEPGLATFVYTQKDGRRLSYSDIFMKSEGLFEAFSSLCRSSLAEQLGSRAVTDMLEAGTAPEVANFDLFALTKDGVRIFFPPYQAAPYSEGYLTVSIPLEKLSEFKPQMAFWDKN